MEDVFYLVGVDHYGRPWRNAVGPYHKDELDALARGKAYVLSLGARDVYRVAPGKLRAFQAQRRVTN